jgi:hypothetical protein
MITALAAGPDSSIYGGVYGSGNAFIYKPLTGSLVSLGRPVPGAEAELALVRSGSKVYGLAQVPFGNNHRYKLFSYAPGAANANLLGTLYPGSDPITLGVGADGILYSGANQAIISYDPAFTFTWDKLNFTASLPPGTTASVDVLSVDGTLLRESVPDGASLAGLDSNQYPILRLRANLSTPDLGITPRLENWSLAWSLVNANPRGLNFLFSPLDPDESQLPLTIQKTGRWAANWTLSSDQTWLTVDPPAGIAPALISVRTNKAGLAFPGTYTAALTLDWSVGPYFGQTIIPVSLYIGQVQKTFLPSVLK